jgi:hypothetical protein
VRRSVPKVWPKLNFVLQGKWRKYRGIPVEKLGTAIKQHFLQMEMD